MDTKPFFRADHLLGPAAKFDHQGTTIHYYIKSPEYSTNEYCVMISRRNIRQNIYSVLPQLTSLFFYKKYVLLLVPLVAEITIKKIISSDFTIKISTFFDCMRKIDEISLILPAFDWQFGDNDLFGDPITFPHELAGQNVVEEKPTKVVDRPRKIINDNGDIDPLPVRDDVTKLVNPSSCTKQLRAFFESMNCKTFIERGCKVRYFQNDPRLCTKFQYTIIPDLDALQSLYAPYRTDKHLLWSCVLVDDIIISIPHQKVDAVALGIYAFFNVTMTMARDFRSCFDEVVSFDCVVEFVRPDSPDGFEAFRKNTLKTDKTFGELIKEFLYHNVGETFQHNEMNVKYYNMDPRKMNNFMYVIITNAKAFLSYSPDHLRKVYDAFLVINKEMLIGIRGDCVKPIGFVGEDIDYAPDFNEFMVDLADFIAIKKKHNITDTTATTHIHSRIYDTCFPKDTSTGLPNYSMTPEKFIEGMECNTFVYKGLTVKYCLNNPLKCANFNYAIVENHQSIQTLHTRNERDYIYFYSYLLVGKILVMITKGHYDPSALHLYDACDVILGFAEHFDNCFQLLILDNNSLQTEYDEHNKKIDAAMKDIQKFHERCQNKMSESSEEDFYEDDTALVTEETDEVTLPSYYFEYCDPNEITSLYFVAIMSDEDLLFFSDHFKEDTVDSIVDNEEYVIFITRADKCDQIVERLQKLSGTDNIAMIIGYAKDYNECIEQILMNK